MTAKSKRFGSEFALDCGRILLLLYVGSPIMARLAGARLGLSRAGPDEMGRLFRLGLEKLGVTYLKLGQYLATRFDLLPASIYREFTRLFEDVSPLAFGELRTLLEAELGGPVESLFCEFETEPIASASVAQVHRARTIGGELVAVKIQRPGVLRIFESDFRNLRRLAALADSMGVFGTISVREVVSQFGRWTRRELDFRLEARTAILMARNATPEEIVPRVLPELTTERVLTMEYVEGISLSKIAALLEEGRIDLVRSLLPNLDFQKSGRNLAFAALHQLFVTGIFHGDPHPGNILIRNDNRIAFVDFGIFGELTPYERKAMSGYIENMALGRIEECYRSFAKLTFPSDLTDVRQFAREARAVFQRFYDASHDESSAVGDKHMGKYTVEIFDVVRRNHVRMDMETLLFWRTLNALDSSALRLSEHFDLFLQMRNFFAGIRPSVARRTAGALCDALEAPGKRRPAGIAPGSWRRLLEAAACRRLTVSHGRRLSAGTIRRGNSRTKQAAALFVALSMLLAGWRLFFNA